MDLETFIDTFKPDMREIDALGWQDVRTIKAERNRLEAQARFNEAEERARQNVSR